MNVKSSVLLMALSLALGTAIASCAENTRKENELNHRKAFEAEVLRKHNEKDKFILISTNSAGCTKYRYNDSIVWKCPKELGLNSVESTYCRNHKKYTCKTHQEPVIGE